MSQVTRSKTRKPLRGASGKPSGALFDESPAESKLRQAARLERKNAAAWAQAVEDIVASTSARAHCAGEKVRERQRKVRETLLACLPLAQVIFREWGHPVEDIGCTCRAHALLDANAFHATENNKSELRDKMIHNRAKFDAYMERRS